MFTATTTTGREFKISFGYKDFSSKTNGTQKITNCLVTSGENTFTGTAFCNPHDQFCRALGRKLALHRALAYFKLTKEERTEIWTEYFKTHKKQ